MFAWGIEHGLVCANPFAGLKLASAPVREQFLSKGEAGRLLDALARLEIDGAVSGVFADALRLLLLTGARKTEILGLRWREVDIVRNVLVLPPERTKAGAKTGERRIPLSAPALEILVRRRRDAEAFKFKAAGDWKTGLKNAFVFPASRGAGHAIGLRRAFKKACAIAELPDLRIHDLRHSFASFAIANGASLFLIGKLLGHASARSTERYAHLSNDPLRDAVDRIGLQIMAVGDCIGEVVPLTPLSSASR
jgi:integrase